MTGLATFLPELEAKSLQLLTELVPGLNRVAVLLNPDNPLHDVNDASAAKSRSEYRPSQYVRANLRTSQSPSGRS
jgi:hypothetical protein